LISGFSKTHDIPFLTLIKQQTIAFIFENSLNYKKHYMEEKTIVCISCYYKGYDFMDEMKKLGNKIILVTSENLKEKTGPGMPSMRYFICLSSNLPYGIWII
jgi:hypothetical protein